MDDRSWPAPLAEGPIDAVVTIPGSKSATNRALVLAALADGSSTLAGALLARDTHLMMDALVALGTSINAVADKAGNAVVRVTPGELRGHAHVDVGLAGTVMRFVPPLAALARGPVTFDGDPRARERPLGPMIAALRALGVSCSDHDGFLPLRIDGTGHVTGGDVQIDASASSQFVSGLLLAAARFDNGIALSHVGDRVPSQPHIDMTVAMLAESGVIVACDGPHWRVSPQRIAPVDRTIEPDLSNAGPFLAAAAATGGRIRIPDWPTRTTQAGDALRGLLAQMGCTIERDSTGLLVTGPASLIGIDADLGDVGELTPVLAALCTLADTPSRLRGIAHLRGHETDRLAALVEMITNLGGTARETPDGIVIEPAALHAGVVPSYDDHRMATAAAVIGLVIPGVRIQDIATTAKTLPRFQDMWVDMVRTAS